MNRIFEFINVDVSLRGIETATAVKEYGYMCRCCSHNAWYSRAAATEGEKCIAMEVSYIETVWEK